MKKRKRKRISLVLVSLLLVAVLTTSFSNIKKASGSTQQTPCQVVTVQSGDTLWKIVKDNCTNYRDIRRAVYDIKKINNIDDAGLVPGLKIKIPACYSKI